jgi:hypothetical protein
MPHIYYCASVLSTWLNIQADFGLLALKKRKCNPVCVENECTEL